MLKRFFAIFSLIFAICFIVIVFTTPNTVKATEYVITGSLFWDPQQQEARDEIGSPVNLSEKTSESSGVWFCLCPGRPPFNCICPE